MFHQKPCFGRPIKRKRRNSKYQRCRETLRKDSQAASQAAQLTLLATSQNRLWALKPFSEDFSKVTFEQFAAQAEQRYEQQANNNTQLRRLRTQQSQYRRTQKPNLCYKPDIKRSLDRIINLQDSDSNLFLTQNSNFFSTELNCMPLSTKTNDEVVVDQYISETAKARQDQLMFKSRISQKFMERYPERRRVHKSEDFTEFIQRSRKITDVGQSSLQETWKKEGRTGLTYFYSRSRKKCFMERYLPEERKQQPRTIEPTISFMRYLSDDKVRKSLQKPDKKQRCVNLMRRKDNILKMQRPGTRKHQRLKECLDEIIMENILR